MGVSREVAEIALENIDRPDPELALDWIQTNHERIGDLTTKKVLEMSKMEAQRSKDHKKMESAEMSKDLVALKYEDFIKEVEKGTK